MASDTQAYYRANLTRESKLTLSIALNPKISRQFSTSQTEPYFMLH